MSATTSLLPILCGCAAFGIALFPHLLPKAQGAIEDFRNSLYWLLPYRRPGTRLQVGATARLGFMAAGIAFVLLGLFAAAS